MIAMSDTIASLIADPRLSLLLGVAVRSLIVPVLGALILVLMGRRASASARYLVMLVCMLGLLIALPLLSWVTPVWRVPVLPASVAPVATPGRPVATSNASAAMPVESNSVVHTSLAAGRGMLAPVRVPVKSSAPVRSLSLSPAGGLTLLWLGGAALYGGWLLLGRLRLWRLAQRCPVMAGGPLTTLIGELAARCDVQTTVVVRQAAREDGAFVTPMTWGWLHPVLLLPGGVLEEWPAERLRAVLLHELAHIARLDWLTQVVTQLACALYWFNPLVWRMAGAMEREAEQACDDRVLLAGVEASDYASHLLEVVKSLRMLHGAVLQGGAQTMAAPRSNVQARLIAILAADRNRAQATRRALLLALVLSVLVLAPLAALHPAQADDSARRKATTEQADADPAKQATEWSWRGEWAKAATDADAVLKDPNASESLRANAYWIKFESAWWMDDPAESDRNYQIFAAIAKKHPHDTVMQANLKIANAYRAQPAPKTQSNEEILATIQQCVSSEAYADALHYARYLLNRHDVPVLSRAAATVWGYTGARYWNYKDTQEFLHQEFQAELKQLPKDQGQQLMAAWEAVEKKISAKGTAADDANPVSGVSWKSVTLDGPTNLDFRNSLAGWKLSAQAGTGADYRVGVDPHGAPDSPSAFLTASNNRPTGDSVLVQACRADAFRGKRIRYSVLIRTEGVQKSAGFYLHLDAPDRVRTWNQLDRPILGTTAWKRYEYVADVAENNQGFIFGIGLEGKGKIWVRDVRFEVVDQSVPLSPISNDFPIKDDKVSQDDISVPEQPANFAFKKGLEGWGNDNPTHQATEDYQIGIDARATYNGHIVAFLTSKVQNPRSYGTLMQNISAAAYRGKRIRYSATLKTQGAKTQKPEEGAGLWIVMRAAKQQESAAWNMTGKPIQGMTDWKQYSWVLDVPTDAQTLSLGIDQTGKGKVWVSNFQIEVVGNDVPVSPSTD
jgi:beta-lactamase regulating signal transducer with metallopeptidase domain